MTLPEARIFISLGSNIAPEDNLAAAVRLLREKCRVLALSSVYRTAPQGFTDQPDFLNMAVKAATTHEPETFKGVVLDSIESALKRVRDPHNKNAPRTIDLDLSLWENSVFSYGAKPWRVPDEDILRFAHVAVPLAELAPDYVHPETGQTLSQIAAQFAHSPLQRLAIGLV